MSLFDRDGKAPIDVADVLLADLDGVVYRGPHAIPGAVEALNGASDAGIRVGYLTNNASRTDEQVATHLRALGLRVTTAEVITSPQAAMLVLQNLVPAGSLILVIGGDGIVDELQKAGYRVTRSADDQPAAVVQGFSPDLGWKDLAEAAYALAEQPNRDPIPWVATNTDWTIPQARGIAPGNGTLVSAVHTAVQRLPVFAGKPETPMFEAAFERFGTRNALMLGDRLDTDIKGAQAAGIPSVQVLTGVDRPKQLIAASADMRPTFILETLDDLTKPYPEARTKRDGSVVVAHARVRMNGHRLEILAEGSEPINLLRACCAAVWGSGLAIYGLDIPEAAYADRWLPGSGDDRAR